MKIVGIDLGGTTIKGGLVDLDGKILKKAVKSTPDSPEKIIGGIASVIDELSQGEEIIGVGLGSPGFIDTKNGKVLSFGGNIDNWAWTDIKGDLSDRIPNIPIEIENDGNIAALCEKWVGSAKDLDNFIMLVIGTGLGGAIYTEKERIWNGYGYQGGEFGHAILYPDGILCKCEQKGCVERYVSGTAVERDYKALTGNDLKGEEIFKLYDVDENAREIIDKFSSDLAIFLISLRNIFDPQGIVIGGGLINSSNYWWDIMIKEYNKRVNNSSMEILPASYLNDSGIIGAAKLIIDKR